MERFKCSLKYNTWREYSTDDYDVIQASGKQAMVDKKVMTSSQTDGNCSIVHAVQHTHIWVSVQNSKFVINVTISFCKTPLLVAQSQTL